MGYYVKEDENSYSESEEFEFEKNDEELTP